MQIRSQHWAADPSEMSSSDRVQRDFIPMITFAAVAGRILTPPPERGVHAASTPECQALLAGVKALWIADVEAG